MTSALPVLPPVPGTTAVTALARVGGRGWAHPGAEPARPDDAAPRLAAAVRIRPAAAMPAGLADGAGRREVRRASVGGAGTDGTEAGGASVGRGAMGYAAAAYRAAEALGARPAGAMVELSVRQTADGGRLTVARRTDGRRTVAIEAQVA